MIRGTMFPNIRFIQLSVVKIPGNSCEENPAKCATQKLEATNPVGFVASVNSGARI
jgi:hypothetical protein